MKVKSKRSRVTTKAHTVRKKLKLNWGICIAYAWSYFNTDYSPIFEITFVKKDETQTTRTGIHPELKPEGIVFYSLTDAQYKTAKPEKVLSLIAKKGEIKT